jgi:hypothetical protein
MHQLQQQLNIIQNTLFPAASANITQRGQTSSRTKTVRALLLLLLVAAVLLLV